MCPTAVSILDILLSVFENLMLPSCWDLCMRTSTVHLFISSRGLLRGMKGSRRVWAECDCIEAEEKIPWRVRTTLAVSWADWCMWVTGSVCVCVCVWVRVWMEDDPPTLSHIGWGALAVRGAHLLNTGLTHCLRGRIRGKRVTPHSPRPRGGLCERVCVCVCVCVCVYLAKELNIPRQSLSPKSIQLQLM